MYLQYVVLFLILTRPKFAVRYDNPICRTGPPGYIGWRESIPGLLNHLQYGLRREGSGLYV
jgi:hypothetical protein